MTQPLPQHDATLLSRWASRQDQQAWGELARRHGAMVYAAARRQLGGDSHLAEDVTQGVFLLLSQRAGALATRQSRSVAGWLYRAAGYAARDARRAARRRARHEAQAAIARTEADVDTADDPWEQIAPLLDVAMGRLRDSDRELVLMRYFENCSLEQAGASLGISTAAATKRLSRAIQRLRRELASRGVSFSEAALPTLLSTHAAPPYAGLAPAGSLHSPIAIHIARSTQRALRRRTIRPVAGTLASIVLVGILCAYLESRPGDAPHRESPAVGRPAATAAGPVRIPPVPVTQLSTFQGILAESDARPAAASLDGACYMQAYDAGYFAGSPIYVGVYVLPPGTQTWRYFPYKPITQNEMIAAAAGGSPDAPLVVTHDHENDKLTWRLQRLSPIGPPALIATKAIRPQDLPLGGNSADFNFFSPLVGCAWSASRLRITTDGGKTWSADSAMEFLRPAQQPAGLPQEDCIRSVCWLSDHELVIGTELTGVRLMVIDRGQLHEAWRAPQPFDQFSIVRPLGTSAVFACLGEDFLVLDRATGNLLGRLQPRFSSFGCMETDGDTLYVCDNVSLTHAHLRSFRWTGKQLVEQPMIITPQPIVMFVHRRPMLLVAWDPTDGSKQALFAVVNGKVVRQSIAVQKMPNRQGPDAN